MATKVGRIAHNNINASVKAASYAVRGPIVSRAQELAKTRQVFSCNIGNPHALNQKSLSYIRNVLSLVINPALLDSGIFPADCVRRAKKYLASLPDIGAYTESQGIQTVREEVAQFLLERDGHAADPANIFLTNGASEGVRLCMQTILREPAPGIKDGILTPIPQYPLYSALSTLLKGELVPYYLDEAKGWACSTTQLSESLAKAKAAGVSTRALVVINPGNPTGQLLDPKSMRDIISWCIKEQVCLMADEVYQENIWKSGASFTSFRKVALDMGAFKGNDSLQMISFHSVSKGFLGECGFRGGYFELLGLPAEVKAEIYKLASISLCSNTVGQIATGVMVQPPKEGDESYETYKKEKGDILSSLQRRSAKLSAALNKLQGMSCQQIDGAMYAFPTITLPQKAVTAAASMGVAADAMYCMGLLEATGIVVVPGSGFGQVDGTFHFRTTILPPEDKMDDVVVKLTQFHNEFMKKYA